MNTTIFRWMLVLIVSAAAVCLSSATVYANDPLQPEIAGIAKSIKKLLDSREIESIAVGQFAGPAGHLSNYGPGIEEALGRELHALKIKVSDKAGYKVQGEFVKGLIKDAADPSDVMILKLNFRLYDRAGDQITELPLRVEIRKNTDLARILGIPGPLSPKGDYFERNQDLQRNMTEKMTHVEDTKIQSHKNSPFAVEILVKPHAQAVAKARPPRLDKHDVFVDIARDELYEVRIHNNSHIEAAVTLHIDGLSVFTFSEVRDAKTGGPKYNYFIIAPRSASTIHGWHKRNNPPDNFLSFLVTGYGQGTSRFVSQPTGKVGLITLTFAYAWTGKEPPPEERGSRDSGNETGFGPPVSAKVQEVQRQIGVVRDVISIRYSRNPAP